METIASEPGRERVRGTAALALGGMMASLSALLFVAGQVPPLIYVFNFWVVFPLIYAGLLGGTRMAALTCLAATAVTALLAGPRLALAYVVPFGVMGPILVWLFARGSVPRSLRLAVALAVGCAVFAKFFLIMHIIGDELPLRALKAGIEHALAINCRIVGALLSPFDWLAPPGSLLHPVSRFLHFAWGPEFHRVLGECSLKLPLGLALWIGLQLCYPIHAFGELFFRRLGVTVPPAPHPADFRMGLGSHLALALSHGLVLATFIGAPDPCGWLGATGLLLVGLAFYVVGLGAVQRLARTRIRDQATELVLTCAAAIVLSPLLIVAGYFLSARVASRRSSPSSRSTASLHRLKRAAT